MWEFPIFVLIGIAGGLMGAIFIHLNVKITMWRKKYIPVENKNRRWVIPSLSPPSHTSLIEN